MDFFIQSNSFMHPKGACTMHSVFFEFFFNPVFHKLVWTFIKLTTFRHFFVQFHFLYFFGCMQMNSAWRWILRFTCLSISLISACFAYSKKIKTLFFVLMGPVHQKFDSVFSFDIFRFKVFCVGTWYSCKCTFTSSKVNVTN